MSLADPNKRDDQKSSTTRESLLDSATFASTPSSSYPPPPALLSGPSLPLNNNLFEEEESTSMLDQTSSVVILRKASLTANVELFRTRFQSDCVECIKNAYSVLRDIYHSPQSGCVSTSLAEDVISLLRMQNDVLFEFAADHADQQDELVQDVYLTIFNELTQTQNNSLPLFLSSTELCCAAANDFFRMSNKLEAFCDSLVSDYHVPDAVHQRGLDLVAKLSQDAVYAAERIQVFFIREINTTTLPNNFFSLAWEQDWTHNECMTELLQKLDQLLPHAETYLDNDVLFGKVLHSSCRAIVCFYIRCLVEKADSVSRRKKGRKAKPFTNPQRALRRMQDDINLLRQYFVERAQNNVALARILSNEMRMLEVIYECLSADDSDSLETMIVVLHKRTGADVLVTRFFVGDLWALVPSNPRENPGNKNLFLQGVMNQVEPDLEMVSKGMQEHSRLLSSSKNKSDLTFLRIDEMLKTIYEDRIAQGILPLCWACLPKTAYSEGSQDVVAKPIRDLTRRVMELPHRRPSKEKRNLNLNPVV